MTTEPPTNEEPEAPWAAGYQGRHDRYRLHGLRRSRHDRMVGGVAAGVARTLDVDVTLVRVGAVVAALVGGIGVPLYLALWFIVPEEGADRSMLEGVFTSGPIASFTRSGPETEGGAVFDPHRHGWHTVENPSEGEAPPWAYGRRWRGPWTAGPRPDMRIGDAERGEVSDTLSKHYAAGRLDDEEFGQRMAQAMGAKTRSDLEGLLVDLPPVDTGDAAPSRRHGHGRPVRTLALLALMVVGATALSTAMWPAYVHLGWIGFVVVAVLLLRWERHWHHHHAT